MGETEDRSREKEKDRIGDQQMRGGRKVNTEREGRRGGRGKKAEKRRQRTGGRMKGIEERRVRGEMRRKGKTGR